MACLTRILLLAILALGTFDRASAELTLETLKARQAQMRNVVRTAHPATVGILFPDGEGEGSGVLVHSDGLILTAAHVSGEAGRDVTVVLSGGEKLPAKTLGAYRSQDAGMIQIIAKGRAFPTVPLGDSDALEIGQWCLAVGHPGGFLKERTAPVRLGRILDEDTRGFLITDSTLVGGDSGGPLLDLQGRLIGIHSSIGYDLAENRHVPIKAFRKHWDAMKSGQVKGRLYEWLGKEIPFLGVQVDPYSTGMQIQRIFTGSPAEKAGLQVGETILTLDLTPIVSGAQFLETVRSKAPKDRILLTVEDSEGDEREIKVRLGRLSDFMDDQQEEPPPEFDALPKTPGFLGVRLTEGNGQLIVTEIINGSPAENAGIQKGDTILQYGKQPAVELRSFISAIGKMASGDTLRLLLERNGELKRLNVTLGTR
ncbi:MAG: serine protease Do [Verrucomicrobiales bacterium]|jgi:serine protease Do